MFGPDAAQPPGFDAAQALHQNGLYLYKKWVLFFHPQLAFIAAMTAAMILFKKSPAFTSIGLFYIAVWAVTEMTQQAYLIDALNQIWRPAYLAADGVDKEAWRITIQGFSGVSDSQYFLLIFGFGMGSLLFGFAFPKQHRTSLLIGIVTSLIGFMSLISFASYYAGAAFATPVVAFWYGWLYGPLQISVRLLLGWWLWQQSKQK